MMLGTAAARSAYLGISRLGYSSIGTAAFNCHSVAPTSTRRCLTTAPQDRMRVCIVGGGPAGFYTAHQILKKSDDVHVDIIEKLPVPYGLVRFGVAPDHPEVKNCIEQFDAVAQSDRVRFYGNVELGGDKLNVKDLQSKYSAVVLSYGADDDRKLGIPGEDLQGVYSARSFVGWYNGLPEQQDLMPNLDTDTAVVLGQGNVALDIARMLLAPIDELTKTDITEQAIEALQQSRIERVICVGRRGPLEAAFTIKELREQSRMTGCDTIIHPEDVAFSATEQEFAKSQRALRRLSELMSKVAETPLTGAGRQMEFMFQQSPVEFFEDPEISGRVGGIRLERNILEGNPGARSAKGTGEITEVQSGAIFRSIGYKGVSICPELPFDGKRNVIPTTEGRVDGIPGVYATGWIRTGPTGVIATTMQGSFGVAGSVIADIENGVLSSKGEVDESFFSNATDQLVTYEGWKAIEKVELEEGSKLGKYSNKCTRIPRMLEISKAAE